MATALTVYMTGTAATTVATADTLVTAAPASSTSHTTKIGTLINWGELFSQGSTATWPAGASAPNPSGHGFLLDATTLELRQLSSGTYTPSVSLKVSLGSIVADIHVRLYKRSSGGVFTLIADCVKAATTINTTQTTFNSGWTGNTGIAAVSFAAGDKLYLDVVIKITTNSSGSSTATCSLFQNAGTIESSSTPGYVCDMAGVVSATASNPNTALKVTRTISGAVSGTASSPNIPLTILRKMSGTISGTASNPSAALKVIRKMQGIISGTASNPSSVLKVTRKMSGAISASTSLTAPLKVTRTFQGTITTSSTLQSALTVVRRMTGTIATSITVVGTLTVKRIMSGVISASASNSGTLSVIRTFAGTISSSVVTSGTLRVIRNFTGIITDNVALFGDLTVVHSSSTIALAGIVTANATLSGTLTVIRAMQGTVSTSTTIRPAAVGVIRVFAGVINVIGDLFNLHFSVLVKHSITGTYYHTHKMRCTLRSSLPLTVSVNKPIQVEGLYKRIHP